MMFMEAFEIEPEAIYLFGGSWVAFQDSNTRTPYHSAKDDPVRRVKWCINNERCSSISPLLDRIKFVEDPLRLGVPKEFLL